MKTKSLFLIMLGSLIMFPSHIDAQKVKFASAEDSLSYALGVANYKYYVDDSISVNAKMFSKGITDASKSKNVISDTVATEYIVEYMQKREEAKLMAQHKEKIEEGKKFFADNAKEEGVITLPSGLQYKVITQGSGEKPSSSDVVVVHYSGKTTDGTKFDSSYDRGEPARFRLSNVIKGWVEGLQLMPQGSKFILYIPYDLAYGERGAGNVIKPFETLIFEVELLEIIKE